MPAKTYSYRYPHPAVAADCVVFGYAPPALQVLLIRRAQAPHAGRWALPGGFVEIDEPLEMAAARELAEETGLTGLRLEQLAAFGDPDRDPRERVISVVFWGCARPAAHPLAAGSDASAARWFPVDGLPALAFDHRQVLALARRRLREQARLGLEPLALLPEKFTLPQAERLAEILAGEAPDRRNFRRRLLASGALRAVGAGETAVRGRPAGLYALDRARLRELKGEGFPLLG